MCGNELISASLISLGLEEHGWNIVNGKLTTKWSEADLIPQELIDVLVSEGPQEDADQEEEAVLLDLSNAIFE